MQTRKDGTAQISSQCCQSVIFNLKTWYSIRTSLNVLKLSKNAQLASNTEMQYCRFICSFSTFDLLFFVSKLLFVKINLRCKVKTLKTILIMLNNRFKKMNYLNCHITEKDKWAKNIVRLNTGQDVRANKCMTRF